MWSSKKKIAVLTGGGDCPGLNAVIRAVVRRAIACGGYELLGLKHGWRGLLNRETMPLNRDQVSGILYRGGTILGSSRTNVFKDEASKKLALKNIKKLGLDAIIAIGGEDTLGVATKLSAEGVAVVGVPKTIDNDLRGTDFTFGFNTAVEIATEAIDRLHTTAESHDRVLVCEVMGRHAGWIATYVRVTHMGTPRAVTLALAQERVLQGQLRTRFQQLDSCHRKSSRTLTC